MPKIIFYLFSLVSGHSHGGPDDKSYVVIKAKQVGNEIRSVDVEPRDIKVTFLIILL